MPLPCPRHRPGCRGFTLAELTLALVVIAFLAAYSISSFFAQGDMTLHNALKLLAEDLRQAQNRASYLQLPVSLVFDASGDGYHLVDGGPIEPHKARNLPTVARRYSSDGVFEGVRITRVDLAGATCIQFDERGRALTGGTVVVSYRNESRMLALEKGRGITSLPDSPTSRGWLDHLR